MAAVILFKYTSRSRRDKFFRGLDSIVNNLSNKEDYHILCSFDVDDNDYANLGFIEQLMAYKNVSYYFGISSSKIYAINRDLPLAPPFDILVNFSDDQVFLMQGFDDVIRNDMGEDFDQFLHYPDTHTKDLIPTMSIMGVDYFKRTGKIYHESYLSVYADNHEMDVAKKLKKYRFIDKPIYDHLHVCWGLAEMDEGYKRTEDKKIYAQDYATYINHKKNNFGL
jgi:hypothetical protein